MATNKFGRNYALAVASNIDPTKYINVAPPFTLQFDINRSVNGSLNTANLKVINLNPDTRNRMLKDFYDTSQRNGQRRVILQAGYGNGFLPTIFYGTIQRCYSFRQGTEYITEITGQTGNYATNFAWDGPPFAAGTTDAVVLDALVTSLASQAKMNKGFIGNFPNKSIRGRTYTGQIVDIIREISGAALFLDNNQINVLNNGENVPAGTPILINSDMGLLGTPRREESNMIIPILFNPQITPGCLVNIQSRTIEQAITSTTTALKSFNGITKVNSVRHAGTISDAVCGEALTEIGVYIGVPAVAS
jgi:hypothetical protein